MRRLLPLLLAGVLGADTAHAVCSVTQACNSAGAFLAASSCCPSQSLTCTLDADVQITGTVCTLDFGNRHLVLAGKLKLGSASLTLRALSVRVQNAIDGKGTGVAAGGNLRIETTGMAATAFRLENNGAQIDLSGPGGGGDFDLFADGNVALERGGIQVSGTNANASAGAVDIETTVGNVSIGTLNSVPVLAEPGSQVELGSPITVVAPGDITVGDTGQAGISAPAGSLELTAGGDVELAALSLLKADRGGDLTVNGATLTARGRLFARDGGRVVLGAASGILLVDRPGSEGINCDAGAEQTGGVEITASSGGPEGTVSLNTPVSCVAGDLRVEASGTVQLLRKVDVSGAGDDDAGSVDVTSALGDVMVLDNGRVVANDDDAPGDITLEALRHDVVIGGDLTSKASAGPGGSIVADAGNDIQVSGATTIDASGAGDGGSGGEVVLEAAGDLEIALQAHLVADGGRNAPGGALDLTAGSLGRPGTLRMDGSLQALGSPGSLSGASQITLDGCTVSITANGRIDSHGDPAAQNLLIARTALVVGGNVVTSATGCNRADITAAVTGAGTVNPVFGACTCPGGGVGPCVHAVCTAPGQPANCLLPCPTCGNGSVEFPEQCDGGAMSRCVSGCTPLCRTENCGAVPACRQGLCDGIGGCYQRPSPDGADCDDDDACSVGEHCQGGTCGGAAPRDCDDHDPCTGTEGCTPATGCTPGTPLVCDDGQLCTTDMCVPGMGCDTIANTLPCEDGNVCTEGDTCGGRTCQSGGPRMCDAGEVCTPPDGCGPAPQCDDQTPCPDDGNPCNGAFACVSNQCVLTPPPPCGDGDPCNGVETCDPSDGSCDPGPPCDDGNACNGVETCSAQTGCQPGTPPNCVDGDACTDDTCDPDVGCPHTPIAGCCNQADDCPPDPNVCKDAGCVGHACVYTTNPDCCVSPGDCDDDNACTADGDCVGNRCQRTPLDGPQPGCGDLCRPGTCDAGSCVQGDPVICDDQDPCTDDACNPPTGLCTTQPVPGCCGSAADCADDNTCTIDTCDPDVHTCHHVVDPTCAACVRDIDCDPLGACNGTVCDHGSCIAVAALDCDDGDRCTEDTCPDAGGCVHQPLACDDHRACNGVETCDPSFGCRAGTAPDCDDHDHCTDDTCDDVANCQNLLRTGTAGVRCQFANIADLIGAADGDVSPKVRRRLDKALTRVGATLSRLDGTTNARKRQRLQVRAGKQLAAVRRLIDLAQKRGLPGRVASALLDRIDGAVRAVQALS